MFIPSHPSELHPQFLSNNSTDPWVDVNSAPRKVMYAGHLPQGLTILGSEERYWQTGSEARYGEYCFSVCAPCDMEVLRVVERFPRSRTIGTTIKNPQTIVIYVDLNTRQVGCLDLRDYNLEHQYFGFMFRKTPEYGQITKGAQFEKGTPFLVSPSIKPGGGYANGLNLMFASFSHPAVADDGIMISKSALKKMSYDLIETRIGTWGQTRHPLNLHGTKDNFKIMKDVGEKIRPDGLLLATREFDERLAVSSLGIHDTMMLDMTYDEKLYTRPGDGTVVDIMVYHDNRSLPNGMNGQIEKYKELTDRFYREILEEYNSQLRSRGGKRMAMTDEFHRLVVEACGMTDYDIGEVVQKIYHKAPIDDWRVQIMTRYTCTPTIGNKGTDCHGGKGVVVHEVEDEDMPINEFGERVEIVMSPDSPYNRQNAGGLYEPYFNQITREFLTTVRGTIRIDKDEKPSPAEIADQMEKKPEVFERVWEDIIELYQILSPVMHERYLESDFDSKEKRALHLSKLLRYQCIHILSPTARPTAWRHAVNACEKRFPPRRSRVTYRDYNGELVTTEEDVEMGHKYFLLLEKISDDWIAVSTAKTQHMGMLGQVTSSDKYSSPAKTQAVKALSEAELRIILSYCGGTIAAELLDRNNSLSTHREFCYALMDSKTPTNIKRGVNRKNIPLGGNRALKLFKHILECNGYKFVYEKYRDPDIGKRSQFVNKSREVLL